MSFFLKVPILSWFSITRQQYYSYSYLNILNLSNVKGERWKFFKNI